MNFDQLTYFCAAAECRNFADASELILVSPSWVSKQISALERELGVSLFFRNPNGVRLTPAGTAFQIFAQKAIRNREQTLTRLAAYADSRKAHVRLGTLPLLAEHNFVALLGDFHATNPNIQVDLCERNQSELEQKLRLYQLDLAIMRPSLLNADIYEWFMLITDYLHIIVNKSHPLAGCTEVSLSEIADERFVLIHQESTLSQTFLAACARQRIMPNVRLYHKRHELLLSSVSKGIGISALPKKLVQADAYYKDLVVCVPLKEQIMADLALVHRRDFEQSDAIRALIDAFCTQRSGV
ncbi:MAG: LysR family transcriptional regulator [Actinomycetes bacterium]|jgi:LysR family transcriptional activator of glutamate synthase operon|nr:LysR family transcriptional regulator [Actinomycetes bacterium]